MSRSSKPGLDPSLSSALGFTKDGHPISYNRAPAPDLAAWIARVYVARIDLPPEHTVSCGLFSETACIRIQLSGQWQAQTPSRLNRYGKSSLFFGPQSKFMPIQVRGGFTSLGVVVRPGACNPMLGVRLTDHMDRLVPTDAIGLSESSVFDRLEADASPEEWLQAVERLMRERVSQATVEPDPITARFEEISYTDPTMSIAEAARVIGVDRRRLERIVNRDYGLPPKQVLKRARALDMASHLRGVADGDEAEALALRYYDESHLIHEFMELFGMSPRQFGARSLPILTLTLEPRQARRLEMMNRIKPGEKRPWQ